MLLSLLLNFRMRFRHLSALRVRHTSRSTNLRPLPRVRVPSTPRLFPSLVNDQADQRTQRKPFELKAETLRAVALDTSSTHHRTGVVRMCVGVYAHVATASRQTDTSLIKVLSPSPATLFASSCHPCTPPTPSPPRLLTCNVLAQRSMESNE